MREPYLADPDVTLWQGDCLEVLRELPDRSVDMVATSPPFFGLRDYGTKREIWVACPTCEGKPGNESCGQCVGEGGWKSWVDDQIGLEETPQDWVDRLVTVFRECRRVLVDHGTLWIEIGDSYAANRSYQVPDNKHIDVGNALGAKVPQGYKQKDLIGQPWMLAFALRADGWYLRSEIIWARPNPMPESVTDRPTKSHSTVFLLSKQRSYFYDADAIREGFSPGTIERFGKNNALAHSTPKAAEAEKQHWGVGRRSGMTEVRIDTRPQSETLDGSDGEAPRGPDGRRVTAVKGGDNSEQHRDGERWPNPDGANARSVWMIPTESTPFAHFACVDDETEALTPHGWRRQSELADGENIAIYDPQEDVCRFEPARFHRYEYDGELVAIDKRDTSQRLTPNHRCYVRKRGGGVAIVEAADLRADMDVLLAAPVKPWHVPDDDQAFARVLGWYIAEGSNPAPGHVAIYQSETANPANVVAIREALRSVGAGFTESRRERVGVSFSDHTEVRFNVRGVIARHLQAHGKTLRVDDICRTPEAARALLDALIDGDGHRRKDGRACIVQKDRDSIDAMQALALRCGYRAHLSRRKDGMYVLYLTDGRWLTLRGTNGRLDPPGREHYTGVVWCPEVSTGLWIARRAGKPFITGNTWPKALVRKMILAGTSEVGICPKCRAPWVRQVVAEGGTIGSDWNSHERGRVADLAYGHSKRGETANGTYRRRHLGWRPTCEHSDDPVPAVVLDPFAGSGTTLLVARQLGRYSVGIELNPKYLKIASGQRLAQLSLLA